MLLYQLFYVFLYELFINRSFSVITTFFISANVSLCSLLKDKYFITYYWFCNILLLSKSKCYVQYKYCLEGLINSFQQSCRFVSLLCVSLESIRSIGNNRVKTPDMSPLKRNLIFICIISNVYLGSTAIR